MHAPVTPAHRRGVLALAAACALLHPGKAAALEVQVLLMDRSSIFAYAPYNVLGDAVLNESGQVALLGLFQTGPNSYATSDLLQWSEGAGMAVLASAGAQFRDMRGAITQNDLGAVGFMAVSQTSGRLGIYLSTHLGSGPLSEVGGRVAATGETILTLGAPQMSRTASEMLYELKVDSIGTGKDSFALLGGVAHNGNFFAGTPNMSGRRPLNLALDYASEVEPYRLAFGHHMVMANDAFGTTFSGVFGRTLDGVNYDIQVGAVFFTDAWFANLYPAAYDNQSTGTGWRFQNLRNVSPALAIGRGRHDGTGLAFVSDLSTGNSASVQGHGVYRFLSVGDLPIDALPYGTAIGNLTEVARTGTTAPGGGTHLGFDSKLFINDTLQVAYSGLVSAAPGARPPSPKAQTHGSIFVNSTDIVDEGELAPTASGATARTFSHLQLKALNNAGAVLFTALLADPGDSYLEDGVFLGDGRDLLAVVRTGDVLAGAGQRQVASTSVSDNALNSHGQVAYRVTFTDNAIATYLYTPTLHWRNESAPRSIGLGSWDDASAWTLGLAPAEMHDVKIDPATRLTLAGPGSDRSVRSLELGTGAGAVRLNLQAGVQLTVLNGGLQIGANGVLSGSGTVAGDLVNRGLIQPTDIVVFDNITNHGRIEGGGHLQGALNNTATGTLSVAAGEQLTVFGFAGGPSTSTAHDNSGTITVAGGGLTLIGGLTNRATLHATDANLSFIGRGFINRANVVLDGTQVDVTGDVFNAASGRIATGEATQVVFHNLVINAGEIAIGAADPAHFLAGLSLSGSSHLSLVLGGNAPSGVALVQAQGAVGLGGVLSLSFATGTVAHAGDSYTLFDFSGATLSHAFAALDLPELGAVGAWDTAELFTSGRIGITAVPEPGAAALLFAGLLTLAFRLRRPARPFIFTTRSLVS